jgi:hypothetical protein
MKEMATFATKFGRFFEQRLEEAASGVMRMPDPMTRVRPFANEDIYFFVKQIDNTAVIRQADPAADRASWKMIGGAVAAAVAVIALLMPKGYGVLAGYEIQALLKENARLEAERALLQGELAAVMSPERMDLLAKEQQFVDPPSDSVVYLDSQDDTRFAAAASAAPRQ